MSAPTLFDTDAPAQTAVNGIIVIFTRPELGLSGEHRGVPALAAELVKKYGDDYVAIGRELHDRECFKCWQSRSCAAYTPHTSEQVADIADLYGGLVRDVAEGRLKLVYKGDAA